MATAFQGIYCPVVTPFVDEAIDFDALLANLDKLNKYDLSGYVILGSTGESVHLTWHERIQLINEAANAVPPDKTIIVGTGFESTRATIEFTEEAAKCGADFALVITPSYYNQATQHASCITHFKTISDRASIPVLIYNVPKFTKVEIAVESVSELREQDNIVGIKESTNDFEKLKQVLALRTSRFDVLIGDARYLLSGIELGARAAILALSNIFPGECVEACRLGIKNDKLSESVFSRILPAATGIVGKYGIAGIKYAMDLVGFKGGASRKPLLSLQEKEKEAVAKCLELSMA